MQKKKLLVIEDDPTMLSTLKSNLELAGYLVVSAMSTAQATDKLYANGYDLIVMDVNLPDGNGFDLCQNFRESHDTPVIFLTANDLERDMLRGYDMGADDYVTKPFSVNVLLKKISAFLKRTVPNAKDIFSDGFLYVDFSGMSALLENTAIQLTSLEFKMLKKLTANPKNILTRQALLESLWDSEENFVDEHALTSSMSRLRGKIEVGGRKYIKTVYGMGYMWMGEHNE